MSNMEIDQLNAEREIYSESLLSQFKFKAKLFNVKDFFGILKAINFDETAVFEISENGIRIIVESSKFIQASAYIAKDYFEEFYLYKNESITFGVNLNVITQCLSISYGMDESCLKMMYKGHGAPFVLMFEHHGECEAVTDCLIKTKYFTEPINYSIDENCSNFNQAVLIGPELGHIFSDINKKTDELEISLSPKPPHFKLTTIGVTQSQSTIEIPKSSGMILSFSCKGTTTARYKMSHIKMVLKSLLLSTKVATRTDASGLLELQFMISSKNDSVEVYIEYYITPLVDED